MPPRPKKDKTTPKKIKKMASFGVSIDDSNSQGYSSSDKMPPRPKKDKTTHESNSQGYSSSDKMPPRPKKDKTTPKQIKKMASFGVIIDESNSQGYSSSDTDPVSSLFNHSGNFEEDFTKLCNVYGIEMVPRVVPRPRRPCSPEPVRTKSSSNNGSRHSFSTQLHRVKGNSIVGRHPTPSQRKISIDKQPEATTPPRERGTISIGKNPQPLTSSREHEQSAKRHRDSFTDNSQPTTFSETDRLSFFTPCVQVKYQQLYRSQQVTEIYIRGWKVDGVMMNVLKYCCIFLVEYLALLQLWNVGLTADTVYTLASFLPMCRHLTTLLLDTNPLGGVVNLSELIDEFSPVEHLSLRFCGVTDQAALGLGSALGTMQTWNRKLLTLNLSNNRITDVGVRHLAKGLMTNRTLLVLNLDSNQIGDEGAAVLAQVLSYFALSQEQIKYRRWITSQSEHTPSLSLSLSKRHSSLDVSKDTLAIKRKKSKADKEKDRTDKTLSQRKLSRSQSREQKQRGRAQHGKTGTRDRAQSLSRETMKKTRKASKSKQTEKDAGLDLEATPLDWHPLAEFGSLDEEGQLRIVGNRSLLSLNLARNGIQEEGLRSLLGMLQIQAGPHPHQDQQLRGPHHQFYQQQYLEQLQQQQQQQQPPPPCCSSTGLKRLVLHHNAVATDNDVLMKIQHLMVTRDPMHSNTSAHVA